MKPIKSEDELRAFENWLIDTLCEWTDFDPDGQIGIALSSKLSDIRANIQRQHERELEKYQELLYAVESKYPDETRHQTALRYIKNAELGNNTTLASNQEGENL